MAGIYIHIPFCKKACNYCNFHFSTSLASKDQLIEAIKEELRMQAKYLQEHTVETIYFGGGTPSLLSPEELLSIFASVERYYTIDKLKEFTLEANPDDLDTAYLTALRKTPINRLSIGVQSFKEADLLFMNRAHTVQQVDYALKCAQDKGFSDISIDLIYGTPQLSIDEWEQHLNTMLSYEIPHFSSYALTVEPKTSLAHQIKTNQLPALNPDDAAQQFLFLMDWAKENNFDHYEISNFGKPAYFSKHNTSYWLGEKYLGVGPSAHSFNGVERCWNISNNTKYSKSIFENKLPVTCETLSINNRFNEYIMTGLRTIWGVSLAKMESEFGTEFLQVLTENVKPFIKKGLLEIKEDSAFNKILTTTKKGKFWRRPGYIGFRSANAHHRVDLKEGTKPMTIFIPGPFGLRKGPRSEYGIDFKTKKN